MFSKIHFFFLFAAALVTFGHMEMSQRLDTEIHVSGGNEPPEPHPEGFKDPSSKS